MNLAADSVIQLTMEQLSKTFAVMSNVGQVSALSLANLMSYKNVQTAFVMLMANVHTIALCPYLVLEYPNLIRFAVST